jgi:hypothetical protein
MITQTPTEPPHTSAQPKIHRVEVYWTSVTYKTVIIYASLALAIIAGGVFIAFPNLYSRIANGVSNAVSDNATASVAIEQNQAKFVNLDGKVQVKKVNSVQWVDADYRTKLDKGDQIQTSGDGAARITFADGTTYTVKADTFITVEENSMGHERPSSSVVSIKTGSVDLSTPSLASPDSKAAVNVDDATAQVHSNSRIAVKANPDQKESEIVVKSGNAEVKRGEERIELAPWQKVNIPTGGPIQKSQVLAPPELVEPLNLAPIIVDNPKSSPVRFEWKPVTDALSYTVRISTTAMFTKTVKEAKVSGTNTELTGLDAGDYFWNVIATDAKKQTSEVSETFKFTLVAQGKSQEMLLQIDGTQLHGRVAEIYGHTEPGAALIVNGQPVASIAPDGSFRHFTDALEPGQHTIVIIGSNRRGGTEKQQISIVVPK